MQLTWGAGCHLPQGSSALQLLLGPDAGPGRKLHHGGTNLTGLSKLQTARDAKQERWG